MTKEESVWLWLHYAAQNDPALFYEILSCVDDPIEAMESVQNGEWNAFEDLPKETLIRMQKAADPMFLKQYLGWLETYRIGILTPESDSYPVSLSGMDNPPPVLFYKGTLSEHAGPVVWITGTRKPDTETKEAVRIFTEEILNAGGTVLSGLSEGVELEALSIAQTQNTASGSFLGVMPGGIDALSGLIGKERMEKGITSALFLSPFLPRTGKSEQTLGLQKECLLMLSDAIVFIGSNTEAETEAICSLAKKWQKPVYALPGRITDPAYRFTNRMLYQKDAEMALSPGDILIRFSDAESFRTENGPQNAKEIPFSRLTDPMQRIYMALRQRDMDEETLIDFTDLDPEEALDTISRMEKQSIIIWKANGLWSLDSFHTAVTFQR